VSSVSFGNDYTTVVSCSEDTTARVSRIAGEFRSVELCRDPFTVTSIRWHPDGRHAARGTSEGDVHIWSVIDNVPTASFSLAGSCVSWHPDGSLLAGGRPDGVVTTIDGDGNQQEASLHDDYIGSIDWHPGGEFLATASLDGRATVFHWPTGEIVGLVESDSILSVARWSPDGETLAIGSWNGHIYLFHPFAGAVDEMPSLTGHTAGVHSLTWSPDGTRIVTTSGDGTARIWRTAERCQIAQLQTGEAAVVDWSADGRYIATGSRDGVVRVWDATVAELVQELPHAEAVRAIAWSEDGERLLVGGERGGVWSWQVGTEQLHGALSELLPNLLSDETIREVIPGWPSR
jgi:WD40 repeat protein